MTRRTRALSFAHAVLGIVAGLSLGCLSTRPPLTCPERGGPPWSELVSEHLVLRTDVDPGAARGMLAAFEAVHDALAHVMPRPRQAPGARIEVVVFDRREDYAALSWPERWAAGLSTQKLDADFEPRPIAVLYDDPIVGARVVFAHELAHRFLRERFPSLPPWLDEGLAQLYSTLRIEDDRIVLGEALPAGYLADLADPPTVRELLGAGERELHDRGRRRRFYAAAFRLCRILAGQAPDRLASFLDALERGARPREAFQQHFGPDDGWLERAYLGGAGEAPPARTIAYRPPPETPRAHHILRDGAVHLLWARLRPWGPRTEEAVGRDLDEALARDPEAAEAHYVRGKLHLDAGRDGEAAREIDAALARHPDEPRYLYARLVVGAPPAAPPGERAGAGDGEPARALLERLARVAGSAAQLGLVADRYGLGGDRTNEALVFAERALRADPMCWQCERIRSRILFLGRRYDEAVRAADRGLLLVPEGEPAAGLRGEREFLARLRDTERREAREPTPHRAPARVPSAPR